MRRFAVHFAIAASLIFGFAVVLNGSVLNVLIGAWQPAGNMSSARTNGTAVLLPDGRIVFGGGTDTDGQPTALVDAFSSNERFSPLPAMSVARSGHAAILTMSGDLLVTGGRTSGGGVTNSAEVFDSISNTWQSLPAAMVDARSGHTMSQLQDGNVLIAGGENSSGPVAALEIYDLVSNTFRFAGVLATARKGHSAAALLDGRVLIAGGSAQQADGSSTTLASTEIYDPASGTVSAGPNLATPRTGATATTLLDGRVLIAGGSYPEGAPNSAAELASAEIFDPVSGTITASASQMSTPRSGHVAILLPNNNGVLIAGGSSAGADLASAELYIPWNDAFQPTGSMSSARASAAGSALGNGSYIGIDGLAVVAGGNNQTGAEVYGFATVKTDKPDYYPGETVTITGTGWQPGETVQLRLQKNDGTVTQLAALADGAGRIANSQYTTTTADFQSTFLLTAVGAASQAQNIFADAKDVTTTIITCTPATVAANGTTTCTAAVADTTNPSFTPTGDVGSWAASVAGGTFTPSSPIKCTLNASAQCSVTYRSPSAASITITAHYQGDGTGQSGHQASDGSFILNATAATQTTASNASANYSLQDQTVALSATVTSNSVVNAGTVTFTVKNSSNATIGSAVTSGTVSAGSASANFTLPATTPTGTYSINAAYSGATGFAASSDSTHTLTVNQADQTITFGALADKTYGDADFAVTATATSGLPVSFSSLTTGICTVISGNQIHIVANGTCTIHASQAGDTNWKAAPNVDQSFSVGKKLATWTTTAASKTYGDADPSPLTTGSGSGFLATDGVTATYARAAGETVAGGPYHITAALSATVAGALNNYTITNAGADFTINPRPATWTTDAASKIYGDADPSPLTTGGGSAVLPGSGFLAADGVTATYTRAAGETVVGGPYHITAALSATVAGALNNYTITNAGADFTINLRPATWTTTAASKTYGDADPSPLTTGSGSPVLPGSGFLAADGVTATYTRAAGETVAAGPYHITAALSATVAGALANYTITNAGADFTINLRPATWTTTAASKTYGEVDPSPLTTGSGSPVLPGSGFLLADGVTATYTRAGGETVAGGPYHITATLGATVAGALANYTITNAGADFTIDARPVTVTPNAGQNKIYGADDPALAYSITSGNLIGTDAFSGALSRDAGQNVGLYNIVGGSLTLGGNYSLTITAGVTFEIKPRPITVTADDKSKVYGDVPDPALTFAVGGNGLAYTDTLADSFTGALTRAAGESVLGGPYAITQGTLAANSNYTISAFTPGKLSITPATLSITPYSGKAKVYGDPFTAFTGTVTGLKFSDAVNVTYASLGSAGTASVGSYDITVAAVAFTTGAASNYNITPGTASNGLVVTQRPVSITANAKSKAYLAPDPAFTYQIISGNLVNGDTFSGGLTRVVGELPGTYPILQGTAALSANYSLSYTGANLTIGYGQCSAAIGSGNVILPPINGDGTSVYPRKGGSTIPVKFRVCDYQGNSISNPAAVFAGTGGSLSMLSAVRGTVTVINEVDGTDIPDVAFRWSGDQWIFNMATSNLASGNTYAFRINLAYGNIGFVVGVK
jgi:MBG domain-containing protein/Big-like domain-containing protein/galactose oxidase-like protein